MHTTFRGAVFSLIAALLIIVGVSSPAMAQHNAGSDSKYAAIVVDAKSGEVLFSRHADSPRYPASITKVMTLYLTFEALSEGKTRLSDRVVISRHAASRSPVKLGIPAGGSISVEDAIQAIAIHSANDIATAMGEHLAGTESRFAALMTLRAQELGMTQTRYVNASGLPDSRQLSSARDIALLSRAIMRDYPQYYAYLSQKQFSYEGRTMRNHNGLLLRMAGVDGLKTGFTNASGYNLSASATRDGTRLIAVVLGGRSNRTRDDEVARLLETGFDVVRRREAGENIVVAQSIFEQPRIASPSYQYASAHSGPIGGMTSLGLADIPIGQGDGRPAGYVVAMKPIANPDGELVRVSTEQQDIDGDRPAAKSKKKAKGEYGVQVGAFKKKSLAQTQLKLMNKRFAKHFANADEFIAGKVNGFFRAQFKGFTADAAQAACSALKAKRVPCVVISPA